MTIGEGAHLAFGRDRDTEVDVDIQHLIEIFESCQSVSEKGCQKEGVFNGLSGP